MLAITGQTALDQIDGNFFRVPIATLEVTQTYKNTIFSKIYFFQNLIIFFHWQRRLFQLVSLSV